MKVPDSAVPDLYTVSQRVFNDELTAAQGVRSVVDTHGLNGNTVNTFIRNFGHLINGRRFRRKLNTFAMRYYLEQFAIEYGILTLRSALAALRAHIHYIEGLSRAKNISMRRVHDEFLTRLPKEIIDEVEQEAVEEGERGTSRAKIISYLKNLKKTDDDHVMVDGKSYKRDNKTLALLKILRGFACQVCNTTIPKRSGAFYIEAAHIKARSQYGRETPDNIMLLCPNHHKEFDHGATEILSHDVNAVVFTMNGTQYTVNLKVE